MGELGLEPRTSKLNAQRELFLPHDGVPRPHSKNYSICFVISQTYLCCNTHYLDINAQRLPFFCSENLEGAWRVRCLSRNSQLNLDLLIDILSTWINYTLGSLKIANF